MAVSADETGIRDKYSTESNSTQFGRHFRFLLCGVLSCDLQDAFSPFEFDKDSNKQVAAATKFFFKQHIPKCAVDLLNSTLQSSDELRHTLHSFGINIR